MPLHFIKPLDPVLVDTPPPGGSWIHEIKYDGYRMQLVKDGGRVRAFSKTGRDWTAELAPVVEAVAALPADALILDGELIATDAEGMPRFELVRTAMRRWPERLFYFAFDLLHLDGRDCRGDPLEERRAVLEALLRGAGAAIKLCEIYEGDAAEFFRAAERMGLEGIVSKRLGSRYRSGGSQDWRKAKCFVESELAVIGVEKSPTGEPLALLASSDGHDTRYMGQALVGLREPARAAFWEYVRAHEAPKAMLQLRKKGAIWLKPGLRAKVRHLRGERMLRHATLTAAIARKGA